MPTLPAPRERQWARGPPLDGFTVTPTLHPTLPERPQQA